MHEATGRHRATDHAAALIAVALIAALALTTTDVWAGGFQDTAPGSTQTLVLEVGRSVILRFDGMTRVAIVHTEIADVTVASSTELIVVADPEGKGKTGNTMLYVWDRRGLHKFAVTVVGMDPAEQVARDLREVLGPSLTAQAISRSMVVIDGEVADDAAVDNLKNLAEASSTDVVKVVSMAVARSSNGGSPAVQAAEALKSIIDRRLKVTAWGNDVLVVEGQVDSEEEAMRARGAVSAFSENLKIVDMISVKGQTLASQAPVAQIKRILGDNFVVTGLPGNVVVVEGQVPTEAELERVNHLLDVYKDQAQTINLVQVVPLKPDMGVVQATLSAALGDEITVKAVDDSAILVEGPIYSEEQAKQVEKVLGLFQDRIDILNLTTIVEPDKRQVLVGVKVVEIGRDATDNLGIDWGQYSGGFGTAVFRNQPFLFGHVPGMGTFNRLYDFATQLHLLIQNRKARVLSEPNLLVNDGEEASILIGGEIPIPVMDNNSVSVEYKEYGVNLKIKPTILNDDNRLRLEVMPEVSSLDYSNGVNISGFIIPGLRTRRAQTQVTLADGSVLAIGGLIQNDQSKNVDKIPVLGDLPIIGQLFRHDSFRNNRTELLILVMPQILNEDGQPAHPIPVPEGYPEDFMKFE
ncbi:MAG: pilus assembly protein N-terminal domain-containing protein [Armatimonadetes bacterium]|nr:pilus assembly protein N-terminal domain-containing protein [Armatimonadota bacterium]